MTREEIIQAISDDKMMPFIQPEQLAQIVEFVIKNYRPSLPSDLDEAAEKYAKGEGLENALGGWEDMSDAFKAGAEWGSEHLRDSTKMIPDGLYEAAENIYKTPFWTRAEDFIAGAEWMAGQGWISVDERLPEMDEEVIVLTDEFDTAPIYKIAFGHIVDVERCIDYNGWNIPGVKYWMPCPEIPNND